MLNLAKFRFQKPKTLPTTLILGERGFYAEKQIFYFLSTVLSKIVAFIIFNFITANNSCSVGLSLNISLKLTLICSIFQY